MLVQSTSFIALVVLVARGHNLIKAKCKVLAREGGLEVTPVDSQVLEKCVLCFRHPLAEINCSFSSKIMYTKQLNHKLW